jgi:hypothetical protein
VAKDRARPFSRKHRKYWIPVTGGMILIGVLNVAVGLCVYEPPPPAPERIIPVLPPVPPVVRPTDGTITLGEIPAAVMRPFAIAYPRHVPSGAKKLTAPDGTVTYEISFRADDTISTITYRDDGTFVSER